MAKAKYFIKTKRGLYYAGLSTETRQPLYRKGLKAALGFKTQDKAKSMLVTLEQNGHGESLEGAKVLRLQPHPSELS